MKCDLACELRQTALKETKALQRIDGVHGALQRQMYIETLEKPDRVLDQKRHFSRLKPIDRLQKFS
ncbi:MAG TPA: hypothetical protein VHR44_00510 [Beijerinckiaceae bacterium]|nr:hypothetical protein [Beijerinckiaceae bacterium]